MSENIDNSNPNNTKEYNKIQWTQLEKITAKIISWGLMVSMLIIIIGGLLIIFELFLLPTGTNNFFALFTQLTTGLQLLIIFGSLAFLIFLSIVLVVFTKKGYKFILNLLFKIEE